MSAQLRKTFLLFGIYFLLVQCEQTPEGIHRALFDDIAAQDIQLQLSMPITTDVLLEGDPAKANNGMANWGELVYFDATLGNPLPEAVSDVELEILGVNNATHIVDWYDDRLDYGVINSFSSRAPDEYLCLLCNDPEEIYLGRTWVEINSNNSGTSSITLDIKITFDFREDTYEQITSHTFTIFP
jgi:hypothetical protein